MFINALCTCEDVQLAGYLRTRGFDSRFGAFDEDQVAVRATDEIDGHVPGGLEATGRIGRHVVTQALDAGHDVRALARRPEAVPVRDRLEVHRFDVLEPATMAGRLDGSDMVFSCVATPSGAKEYLLARAMPHIIATCAAAGCARLATVSSVGVGDSAV